MNFIQIEGWAGAGKGAIWSLLDGHSDIFVNPIHDFSHCALFYGLDHINFRKMLAGTEYYKLEKLGKLGSDPIDLGGKVSVENHFNFDFYKFDQILGDYLSDPATKKDCRSVLNQYMQAYILSYKNMVYDLSALKYFVSMGNYYSWEHYHNSDLMKNIKTIFVRRDPSGIVASRVNREKRSIDDKESFQFAPTFKQLMSVGDVEAICAYNDMMVSLRHKYPRSVLILDFEDIVFGTEKAMKTVAEFLEVEFDHIMCIPTRDGKVIESGETSFVGKVNDNPDEILTVFEKIAIQLHASMYALHKRPVNLLSLNSVGMYIYKKLKRQKLIRGL